MPFHLQFALRLHLILLAVLAHVSALNALVVKYAAIVGEEGAILTCDVNQASGKARAARHGAEAVFVGLALIVVGPNGRFGATCSHVATLAREACVERTKATRFRVGAAWYGVVVKFIARIKSSHVFATHPIGLNVIGR